MTRFNTKSTIILLLIFVVPLSGCGFFGGAEEPTPVPPVELRYISFLPDAQSNSVEPKLIAQFETKYPNITIQREQYQQAPTTYLNQDPPPDVMVAIADYDTVTLLDSGSVLDISAVWRDTNLADNYPTALRAFGEREGRQFFLPVAHTWIAIYYNKALFAENGISEPQTWDELSAVAETFWQRGITPFALAHNDDWAVSMWFDYLVVRLHGPDFHRDLLAGLIPFDDARVLQVFELWQDLIEPGYFGDNLIDSTVTRGINRVYLGEAAMILSSPVQVQDLPGAFYENLAFFSFPVIDTAQPLVEVTPSYGYFIPSRTAHPAEASQLLVFMSTPEVQTALVQQIGDNFGILPANSNADPANFSAASQAGLALIRQAETIVLPLDAITPSSFRRQSSGAFQAFLRDPNQVNEVVDRLEQARQQAY